MVTLPAYPSLYANPVTHGCEVSKWEAEYNKNGWHFNIDDFEGLLKSNTRLVIINFPHNPTGTFNVFTLCITKW